MIDPNEIDNALHEISMMVSIVLGAVDTMQTTSILPRIFQMPDEAGELLCFCAFDIDKRVKALKAALWADEAKPESIKPALSIVRDRA
jgi:hypothetical protein